MKIWKAKIVGWRVVPKWIRSVVAIFAILLLVCCSTIVTLACLNRVGRPTVGTPILLDGLSAQDLVKSLVTHEERNYWAETSAELDRRVRVFHLLMNDNNYAVSLVHLGQVKEAIGIFERLERKTPGQYQTAANLGTAYELDGQDEKALYWITEGVRRNSDDHFGTEWLHVKILEAKIGLKQDPQWLGKHSVMGVDFTTNWGPDVPFYGMDHLGNQRSQAEMESALVYQLHERLEFVPPPDAFVADLLYDLSTVLSLTRTQEHSAAVRELAMSYGPGHERNAPPRSSTESPASFGAILQEHYLLTGLISLVAAGAAAGIWFWLLRKRRRSMNFR